MTTNPYPGLQLGNYVLLERLPDTVWGPAFKASQVGIDRLTKVIFYRKQDNLTEQQFRDYFTKLAAVSHPALPVVIELGNHAGNPYVVEELWEGKTLAELVSANHKFDASQIAYLGEQATGALAALADFSCRTITADDIVINDTGVLRLSHLYPLPNQPPSSLSSQLSTLAELLQNLLSESDKQEPNLTRLLTQLQNSSVSAEVARKSFRSIKTELSATQQLSKKPEEETAYLSKLQTQQKTRTVSRLVILLTFLSLTLLIVAFVFRWQIIQLFFPSGKNFSTLMVYVPEGEDLVELQDPNDPEKTIKVSVRTKGFWIDTYETTIYEYSLFLDAIRKGEVNPIDIMHPDTPKGQRDFLPEDWQNIIKATTTKSYYRDIKLSPNSPIFNVSYYDAYAYAKWKGKRLPTKEEWLRAARGDKGLPYPWGTEPDESAANTGIDYIPGRPELGGKIDGFHGPGPVDDPKMNKDKSPFGARLMFGNLSEWTCSPGTLILGRPTVEIMGNSYTTTHPKPLSHKAAGAVPPSASYPYLGFRLVSDNPPDGNSN